MKSQLYRTVYNSHSSPFCRTVASRAKVTADWVSEGGVLLMGYEMYRLLTLKKSLATSRPKKTKKRSHPVIIDLDEEDRQQEFRRGGWLFLGMLLEMAGRKRPVPVRFEMDC